MNNKVQRYFWIVASSFLLISLNPTLFYSFFASAIFIDASYPDLYEASINELQSGLEQKHFSSVDLVKAYLARIQKINLKGPILRAVLEINPSALSDAAALDHERASKGPRGPLHGIPVLLKDIISVEGSVVNDSTIASKLRRAGAIFLGKTNLEEFSHFKVEPLPLGWSALGGQSTNPYYPRGNPSGSSSGSAISAAIGLATVTLGAETDSSIIYPAAWNNVVGVKPTVGLVSRKGVIPISPNLDTLGPITRSMTDAAIVLTVIAGQDPLDRYTLKQPFDVPDYTKALKRDSLKIAFNKYLAELKDLPSGVRTLAVRVAVISGSNLPLDIEIWRK
ncbi:hypothetical protein Clacol_010172 [Clathrus columnatus]|uniref:Amidase domain-containing protein n=1 Tax=Clathrus columnatus TaxID=1419009 RepID=A0AAV5AT14_9AGAM|nr:hypothetical protein Clacol_010172 [Clathrus columnatus]